MLSGGLDSAPVLSLAATDLRLRNRRPVAVSWTFQYPESDELHWIAMAARSAGIELRTFNGGELAPFSNLTRSVMSPELPYYNPVRELMLECCRLAGEASCPVLLPGTQGDNIYPHRALLLYDLLRRRDWRRLATELGWLATHLGAAGMFRDPAVRYPAARWLARWRNRAAVSLPSWMTDYAREHASHSETWPPEARSFTYPITLSGCWGRP